MNNEVIRRGRVDLLSPVEKAIDTAAQLVAITGVDIRLTRAMILLRQAQSFVADYIEGIPDRAEARQCLSCGSYDTSRRSWANEESVIVTTHVCRSCGNQFGTDGEANEALTVLKELRAHLLGKNKTYSPEEMLSRVAKACAERSVACQKK